MNRLSRVGASACWQLSIALALAAVAILALELLPDNHRSTDMKIEWDGPIAILVKDSTRSFEIHPEDRLAIARSLRQGPPRPAVEISQTSVDNEEKPARVYYRADDGASYWVVAESPRRALELLEGHGFGECADSALDEIHLEAMTEAQANEVMVFEDDTTQKRLTEVPNNTLYSDEY